jgi:hypothetical protein
LRSRRSRKAARAAGKAVPSLREGSASASVVSEDWDILDEILAEGIELYGEDGLAEILADFAETGEITDELAELFDIVEAESTDGSSGTPTAPTPTRNLGNNQTVNTPSGKKPRYVTRPDGSVYDRLQRERIPRIPTIRPSGY